MIGALHAAPRLSAAAIDEMRPVVAGFERYGRFAAADADRIEAGLLLLGELGCTNCHAVAGPAAAHVQSKTGPVLDAVGRRIRPEWLEAYLADPRAVHPGTTMPDLLAGLPADRRGRTARGLAHFLAATGPFDAGSMPEADKARPDVGDTVYERSGCAACHGSRRAGHEPLADQRPLGDLTLKWSPAALDEFLRDPVAVRPSGRMPGLPLTDADRRHLVAALTGPGSAAAGRYADVMAFEGRAWRALVDRLPDVETLGPPAATGRIVGLDVFALAGGREEIVVELRGFFHAPRAGTYAFHLASDDGSRLSVGGTTVVDNDGIHPETDRRGTVTLAAGVHPIRLEYFEARGHESLALDVVPPGGPRTPAVAYVTPTADGTPAVTSEDLGDQTAAFVSDPALVAEGRAAFTTLGCANCHALGVGDERVPPGPAATPLADLPRLDTGCLAGQTASSAPHHGLDPDQRASLAAAVAWLRSPAAAAPPDRHAAIARWLTTSNCYACHDRDGRGGVLPRVATADDDGEPVLVDAARDALFLPSQAELGDEGRRPPTLSGVGGKLRPEFLREVLLTGGRDRTATMPTLMPRWQAAVAEPLAAALADDPPTTCAIPALAGHADADILEQGRHLTGSKALGCIKCHAFAGEKGQSLGLVDLVRMPRRLRHEWFLAYVADPQAFRRGTRMPAAWPDGATFYPDILDGSAAGQIEAVWRYLASAAPRPPIGATANLVELVPTDRPVIYRNFISDAGPRAIGIGFPEGVHAAWDAERLRLALVWRGAFIDAGRHWTGRGAGWQPPLGDGIFSPDAATAVERLDDPAAAWPDGDARQRGGRFRGYVLDAVGRPTFHWSLGGLQVSESIAPGVLRTAGGGRLLARSIRLQGPPPDAGHVVFRAATGAIEDEADGWRRIDGRWRVRVGGTGAGPPLLLETAGKRELRIPVVWSSDGTAELVEELAW